MVYVEQNETAASGIVAQLNANIGGMRKLIRERKTAIADHCIAAYRTASSPAGMQMDSELALWCREILENEERIRELLAELQEYRYRQADSQEPSRMTEPAVPLLAITPPAEPERDKPEPEKPVPPPYPPRFAAPVIPVSEPETPAPVLPTYTPAKPLEPAAIMILCSVCGVKNPPHTRFCQECGEKLESAAVPPPAAVPAEPATPVAPASSAKVLCRACAADNPAGTKFCIECGARLSPEPAPAVPEPEPPVPFCPRCGEIPEPGDKFCGCCGARFE